MRPEAQDPAACKLCGSKDLTVFAHTARCRGCRGLLYWPYPDPGALGIEGGPEAVQRMYREWYLQSVTFNHDIYTHAVRATIPESQRGDSLEILDYGGGGGQFAFVAKSHFFMSKVYITDRHDDALIPEWAPENEPIPHADFAADDTVFDHIFMVGVFEHLEDPLGVLRQLAAKLAPEGRIFIDTPRQFWIYPLLRALPVKGPYERLLRGNVSLAHLQIWSDRSFDGVVSQAGLRFHKRYPGSEFTMPADFYLDRMNITNPLLRAAGHAFYRSAKYIARNKIFAVLSR